MIEAAEKLKNGDLGPKNIHFLRKKTDFPLTFARKHIPHPFGAVWVRLDAAPKLPPRKFENFVIFVHWLNTKKVIEAAENLKNGDFGTKNIQVLRKNTDFLLTFARKHIPHPFGKV